MPTPLYQVDAFTEVPFAGNPAAVCVLDAPADAGWMQRVAREMNLSETAFVSPRADGFDLRWFTPTTEVDLCGHATLATAHVLFETGRAEGDAIAFHSASGVLGARREADALVLDFPADPPAPEPVPEGLAEALGCEVVRTAHGRFDWLAELPSAADVRRLRPDFRALGRVPVRGVIVTAAADDDRSDFVSRFFGPQVGVDEDPVTGSAHCTLGPFWAARLGRDRLVGYQASERGGVVGVHLAGDRARLHGHAVTVLEGHLRH